MSHLKASLSLFVVVVTVCLAGAPSKKKASLATHSALDAKEVVRLGEERLRGDSSQSTMSMLIQRPSYRRELLLRS